MNKVGYVNDLKESSGKPTQSEDIEFIKKQVKIKNNADKDKSSKYLKIIDFKKIMSTKKLQIIEFKNS